MKICQPSGEYPIRLDIPASGLIFTWFGIEFEYSNQSFYMTYRRHDKTKAVINCFCLM